MAPMPWFRLYSEILDDKKIKRICRASEFTKATIIGVWVCLLALASDSDERGKLLISEKIPYDLNDIAYETEMTYEDLDNLLKLFEKHDMLSKSESVWEIKNWGNRQFKSDNVSERVARHRAKRNDVTTMERSGNVIDTESEQNRTESDTEEEYIIAFCQITGIAYPFNINTHAKWIQEVGEWIGMKVTRTDIENAYSLAIEKKYTVARPAGLTNFLRGEIAKANAEKSDKRKFIDQDGNEVLL